ncbi:MAG: helix-turn-helix transcriptional regulator [Deltaproteobacteria bacterium]|nr:helix-turn-helix transcriptional regulator [Deltaproteobacteria bacterium]
MTAPWHRPPPPAIAIETDDDELLTIDRWPREVFAPHFHEEFNWLVPMRPGRIVVRVEDDELTLDGDHWLCIFPRTAHAVVHVSDDTEVLSCFIDDALMAQAYAALDPPPPILRRALIGGRGEIARGLALAWAEQRLPGGPTDAPALAHAAALATYVAGWLWRAGDPVGPSDRVGIRVRVALGALGDQLAAFLDEHLAEQPFPWADLEAALGVSLRTLQRRCVAALGAAPSELVTRARLERAQDLLADPARPLGDIALACGFATQAHFSTVFKTRLGATPSAWRRARTGA